MQALKGLKPSAVNPGVNLHGFDHTLYVVRAELGSLLATLMQGRGFKLKAKLESGPSYFRFRH